MNGINGGLRYFAGIVILLMMGLLIALAMSIYAPKEHQITLITMAGGVVLLASGQFVTFLKAKESGEKADAVMDKADDAAVKAAEAARKAEVAAVTSEKTFHLVNGNMSQFKELMDKYLVMKTTEKYEEGKTVGELIGAASDEAVKQAIRLAAAIPAPAKPAAMPPPLEHPPEPPKP